MNVREALFWAYASLSATALALYTWDKGAAKKGRERVRERTLHAVTWAGGFPGALAGQWLLRHKTRHASFVLGAWFAMLVHVALWAWLASC